MVLWSIVKFILINIQQVFRTVWPEVVKETINFRPEIAMEQYREQRYTIKTRFFVVIKEGEGFSTCLWVELFIFWRCTDLIDLYTLKHPERGKKQIATRMTTKYPFGGIIITMEMTQTTMKSKLVKAWRTHRPLRPRQLLWYRKTVSCIPAERASTLRKATLLSIVHLLPIWEACHRNQ